MILQLSRANSTVLPDHIILFFLFSVEIFYSYWILLSGLESSECRDKRDRRDLGGWIAG